jgi:hypothetical protein
MASAAEERHQEALKEIAEAKLAYQREYNLLLVEQNELLKEAETIFGENAYSKAKGSILQMKQAADFLKQAIQGDEVNPLTEMVSGLFSNGKWAEEQQKLYEQGIRGLHNISIKTGHEKTGLFGWGKGRDIYSSILDEHPDLMKDGKFNAKEAELLLKTKGDLISDKDKESLQYMIDLSNQAAEALEAVKDYLSDIFGELGETMSNALVDAFRNGTDAAEKFSESVTSMLEKLAEQMIYSVTIAPYIKKAQEDMLAIMENENMTDEQKFENFVNILEDMTDDVLEGQGAHAAMMEEYRRKAAGKGINLWESDSVKQSGKAGAYEAASQDSITRLEGLYSSMLENTIGIKFGVENILENMSAALGHLKKIEENTGSSDSHLEKIEKAIVTMRDDISVIKRDGVKTR